MDPSAAEVVANARIELSRSKAALEKLLADQKHTAAEHAAARQKVSDAHRVLERAIRARDSAKREGA